MAERGRRLGLRAKVTGALAGVALVASVVVSVGTHIGVRATLLSEFESGALDQALVNARLIASTIHADTVDETSILAALRPPVRSRPLLLREGRWYAASLQVQSGDVPPDLVGMVLSGQAARQIAVTGTGTALVIGVPVDVDRAAYFEVFGLGGLESSLATLDRTLLVVGLLTTLVGALLGRWMSGRMLRPVRDVTVVAERIAGGALSARLDETVDPDLVALSGSFNRMADALESRIAAEARFASDVSHELRSPLTTLSTALSVLETRRDELSDEGREALDLLAADVNRFQKTVMDLIEISRHDAGGVPVDLTLMPIAEAVRLVLRRMGTPHAAEVAPSAIGAVVSIDVRRLERILGNFIDNAEVHGGGLARIAVRADRGHATVAVEDRGPGIAEEDVDRVFERFARGVRSRRRGSLDGSGLGLALAAENADLVGGRVYVDTDHRPGARLVFETPIVGTE